MAEYRILIAIVLNVELEILNRPRRGLPRKIDTLILSHINGDALPASGGRVQTLLRWEELNMRDCVEGGAKLSTWVSSGCKNSIMQERKGISTHVWKKARASRRKGEFRCAGHLGPLALTSLN